jgi:type II secretory pathway component PulF
MNKPQPPRPAPPATADRRQERPLEGMPAQRAVRTAQRPKAEQDTPRARVERAWALHPLVGMVRHRRRLTFYSGLHSMIRAGLPLNIALSDLSRGAATDPFSQAVAEVNKAVGAGSGLAQAMRRHPVWFEPWVVESIEVAEVSGTLDQALMRIIQGLEDTQRLRRRTLSLCIYPAYLLVAFIVGGSALDGARGVMAAGSQSVLGSSLAYAFLLRIFQVTSIGLAIAGAPLAIAALGLEEKWARFRLKLPLLGGFHRQLQASRFCQVLGSSIAAGLEVARSLRMATSATQNPALLARAEQVVQQLQDGATLTDGVESLGLLEGESLRRIAIGERTGNLDSILQHLAREHSEAGMRKLQTLVFALIAVMAVILFASSVASIFSMQSDYFRKLEDLSHG